MKILYENFKYRGYNVVHSDLLGLGLFNDIYGYVKVVYYILGKCVVETHKSLHKNGFLEFKKSCLLNIITIKKSDD